MLTPTDIFPGFKGVLKKSLKDRKFQGAQHAKEGMMNLSLLRFVLAGRQKERRSSSVHRCGEEAEEG